MQALHGNWLPRITAEILGSLGRCPSGAVSPDREVLRGQHLSGSSSISLFVKVELEVVGSHPAECMCGKQSDKEVKSKVEHPLL